MTSFSSLIDGNEALLHAMRTLEDAGHTAHLVGGAVRSGLLGMPIKDFDISTNATPDQAMEIYGAAGMGVHPTGIEHGTITITCMNEIFEITTWRRDVETDGRRAVVAWADRIEDDAMRRDFTINALYVDLRGEILDPTGQGLADIADRRVRFIGSAHDRIREDALRMLRFFRFSAAISGSVHRQSSDFQAVCELSDLVTGLSKERIGMEMRKILAFKKVHEIFNAMWQSGVVQKVLPGMPAVYPNKLLSLEIVENELGLAPCPLRRLALINGRESRQDLALTRAEAREEAVLMRNLHNDASPAEIGFTFGEYVGLDILALRSVTLLTQHIPKTALDDLRRGANSDMPFRAADLNGKFAGPAIGEALRRAQAKWIASDFSATKAELSAAAFAAG